MQVSSGTKNNPPSNEPSCTIVTVWQWCYLGGNGYLVLSILKSGECCIRCAVTSTHITILLESLPKPGDDTLGYSKFYGYFELAMKRTFWLNGYVNKQNCRVWSEANPQVYVETPLHPEKLTVWCALWAGGILLQKRMKATTLHSMVIGAVFPKDGATCHTAHATIDLLKDTFGDRLISRFGPVNWSPRSYDLTPLDYFLWGYVKSLVYADKPQTLDHLEDNIRRVIADIWPQMLEKFIENWTSRLDYIRASRGSPMPEIIFKL
ncbi:putative DD41D transposase [Trichonephila clavipes]|nr:putative DD41D transposase [Trichonephila clavipes]